MEPHHSQTTQHTLVLPHALLAKLLSMQQATALRVTAMHRMLIMH
jgi:hypothetical protein